MAKKPVTKSSKKSTAGSKAASKKRTVTAAAKIRKGARLALVEPQIIKGSDIDPHHGWERPLQAPGHTQVDFEERIDFRRLHKYRVARVREALANSGLG